jgi:hypothetical protein
MNHIFTYDIVGSVFALFQRTPSIEYTIIELNEVIARTSLAPSLVIFTITHAYFAVCPEDEPEPDEPDEPDEPEVL